MSVAAGCAAKWLWPMPQKPNKATHGGRRIPGPGKHLGPAPLPPDKKRVKLGITLPPWLARWVEARAESKSVVVERALVSYYGIEQEGEGGND